MGDFKCNSGIPADKTSASAEDNNIYNTNSGSDNLPNENISDSASSQSGYSRNNITDSYSPEKESDMNEDSSSQGCGCGTSDDSAFADGDDSAIIYSETVIFTEPYDSLSGQDDMRTSDLVEDEEQGSEFISSDSNKPQC